MDRNQMVRLLEDELWALGRAVGALRQQRSPRVPLPRPRVHALRLGAQTYSWPRVDPDGQGQYYRVWCAPLGVSYSLNDPRDVEGLAHELVEDAGEQPHQVVRCLRWLRRCRAWAQARAEGLDRHAAEILRQQERYVQELEGEIAMRILAMGFESPWIDHDRRQR